MIFCSNALLGMHLLKINFASAMSALVLASLVICTDYRYNENKHIGGRYIAGFQGVGGSIHAPLEFCLKVNQFKYLKI